MSKKKNKNNSVKKNESKENSEDIINNNSNSSNENDKSTLDSKSEATTNSSITDEKTETSDSTNEKEETSDSTNEKEETSDSTNEKEETSDAADKRQSDLQEITNNLKKENLKDEAKESKELNENLEEKDNVDTSTDEEIGETKKKKSKLKIFFLILLLLILGVYIFGVINFNKKFILGTKVRGISAVNKTSSQVTKEITEKFKHEKVEVKLPDSSITEVNYEKNGARINPRIELDKIKKSQNKYLWFLPDNKKYTLNELVKIDDDVSMHAYTKEISPHLPKIDLKEYVKFNEVTNKFNLSKISKDKKLYILNDILQEISKSIKDGKTNITINPANKIQDQAQKLVNRVNKSISKNVPLKYGAEQDTIDRKYLAQMITITNSGVLVNEEMLGKTLQEVSKAHQKIYSNKLYSYNAQKLKTQIKKDIENSKLANSYVSEESIIPLGVNKGKGTLSLGGTYIEVNTQAQKMYVWSKGSLVKTFNVITGDITHGRNTTIGVWNIWGKEMNKVLKGSTVGVGKDYDYNIPVKYWMPIDDTGIGLHSIDVDDVSGAKGRVYWGSDAAFIGKGSHGCVNMHTPDAAWVYNNMALFTKVYVTP